MLQLIQLILQNLTFFALHLKNLTSFPKPLSAKKESELLRKMKHENDTAARNELIEHNLRLVSHIIKKYYAGYDEQEDLISIGTIGLIKAIDSFDIDKGARLATYAARCIENAILTLRRALLTLVSPLILYSTQKLNQHIMYRLLVLDLIVNRYMRVNFYSTTLLRICFIPQLINLDGTDLKMDICNQKLLI